MLYLTLAGILIACGETGVGSYSQPAPYAYPSNEPLECVPGSRPGRAGIVDDLATPRGIKYTVRTPANYQPGRAHPLLVIYAPASSNRFSTERLTGITAPATRAGLILAYADHKRPSPTVINEYVLIPQLIQKAWCIDPARIFLAGHSDGATIATAIALRSDLPYRIAALAPSAGGARLADLKDNYACPQPLGVMLMHSSKDRHFPGFGKDLMPWWVNCNRCDPNPVPSVYPGCSVFPHCAEGVTTLYCAGNGSHGQWPPINDNLIRFLEISKSVAP